MNIIKFLIKHDLKSDNNSVSVVVGVVLLVAITIIISVSLRFYMQGMVTEEKIVPEIVFMKHESTASSVDNSIMLLDVSPRDLDWSQIGFKIHYTNGSGQIVDIDDHGTTGIMKKGDIIDVSNDQGTLNLDLGDHAMRVSIIYKPTSTLLASFDFSEN